MNRTRGDVSRIIGAGLSGLIAAYAWPNVPIVEAQPQPPQHRALLRFRSEAVSHLTGIGFRKVMVRKGLYSQGGFKAPTIALANAYSQKILGRTIGDRSIWNLDPVERFIAPENFQEQLLDHVRNRVSFNTSDDMHGSAPFISTAPLPVALNALGVKHDTKFLRAAIQVQRFRVPLCDAHQTIYFPGHSTSAYRASITGDLLIVESVGNDNYGLDDVLKAFNLGDSIEQLGAVKQEYGKILNLPDAQRKQLLFNLTNDHGLYSLGRFAQWRNILLDDVVEDIRVIKRLMATDRYDLRKAAS